MSVLKYTIGCTNFGKEKFRGKMASGERHPVFVFSKCFFYLQCCQHEYVVTGEI